MVNSGITAPAASIAGEKTSEDEKKRTENPKQGESEVWKDLDNVKGSDRKTSGQGKSKQYYEWDHTHNDYRSL